MYTTLAVLLILFIWGFFIEPELLTVKRYKAENVYDLCVEEINKFIS